MILDYTKNDKKSRKNRKMIFGSELSKANNEPTFRLHQKKTKSRKKNRKTIFGPELSEANIHGIGQYFAQLFLSPYLPAKPWLK